MVTTDLWWQLNCKPNMTRQMNSCIFASFSSHLPFVVHVMCFEVVVHTHVQVKMQPKETLFRVGDDSQSGIFIVVEGRLGVYLEEHDSDSLTLTNTLITGESVGDLDVLDGELVKLALAHTQF